jgi:hypothetical protein
LKRGEIIFEKIKIIDMKKLFIIILIFIFSLKAFNQPPCNTNFSYTADTLGTVRFLNLSNDLSKYFYWDFGDGTTSNFINPKHYYPSSGEYLAKLYMHDIVNNCSDAHQDWLTVYKFHDSLCIPYFTDTLFTTGGQRYLTLTDQSSNCNENNNSFNLSDAGPAGNSAFGTNWIDYGWGHCNFIGDNRYLDTNNYIYAEYMKSIPISWDINANYYGCSANYEYSIQNAGGIFVTFRAMNQNLAFYQWQIIGFGNPVYINTSYAYFNYPYNISGGLWLVQLITTDSTGCSDTTTQQLLLRDPYNTTESLNEISNKNEINIYPNPANNSLTIETPTHSTIQILNIQGQQIKTLTVSGTKTDIDHVGWSSYVVDVSALPAGVYIVQVRTEKGVAVGKFVKE